MRIGLVQLEIDLGDLQVNLVRAADAAARARQNGAELILLPEFFNAGMAYDARMLEVPRRRLYRATPKNKPTCR